MSDEPQPPLSPHSAMLGSLRQHSATLKNLGYDDVDDFEHVGDVELQALKASLTEQGVPIGHTSRIVRLFLAQRPQPPPSAISLAARPPPASPATPAAPATPLAAAVLQESDLVPVDLTAWPRVQALLANADGRIIFGRGPEKANDTLKPYEIAMNEMAGKVLSARPQLLGWEGAAPKVGELMKVCRGLCDQAYLYSKGSSRSGQLTPTGSAGGDGGDGGGTGGSSTGAKPKVRTAVAKDQRTVRLLELPKLIENAQAKEQTAAGLRNDAMQRNESVQAMNHIESLGRVQLEISSLKREQTTLQEAARTAERDAKRRVRGDLSKEDDPDADVRATHLKHSAHISTLPCIIIGLASSALQK